MTLTLFVLYVIVIALGMFIADMLTLAAKVLLIRYQQKKLIERMTEEAFKTAPIPFPPTQGGGEESGVVFH